MTTLLFSLSVQPADFVTEEAAHLEDVIGVAVRRRREAANDQGQPSLRLYHTLQTPGPAVAPPAVG